MTSTIRAVDNRNADDMIVFMEARIEALQARIRELEQQLREQREDVQA